MSSDTEKKGWKFLNDFLKHIETIVILPARITRYNEKKNDPDKIKGLDEAVSKLEKKRNKNLNSKTIDKILTQLYARNDPNTIDTLLKQEGIDTDRHAQINKIRDLLYPPPAK